MHSRLHQEIASLRERLEKSLGHIARHLNTELSIAEDDKASAGAGERPEARLLEAVFRPPSHLDCGTALEFVDNDADSKKLIEMLRSTNTDELLKATSTLWDRAEEVATTSTLRDKLEIFRLLIELAENHLERRIHIAAAQAAWCWIEILPKSN